MSEIKDCPAGIAHSASLTAFIRRVMARQAAKTNCGWGDILIPQGLALCAKEFGNQEMKKWVEAWLAHHTSVPIDQSDFTEGHFHATHGFSLNTYCGGWGAPLVLGPMYDMTGRNDYASLLQETCNTILNRSVRLTDGVMAHGGFAVHTVWVDTLYYAASSLAEAYRITKETNLANEAVRQCILHARWLQDSCTGCFFHDAHPATGRRTNWFWSRGNGWVILALADTLRHVPAKTEGYGKVLEIYRSLVTGLLRLQHPCGLWRIVPELSESHLETSGSIMIATGIAMGVADGWLENSLAAAVQRTLEELKTWIRPDGALMGAQRPAGSGGWDVHKLSRLDECEYATGLMLRLLAESQRMSHGVAREEM